MSDALVIARHFARARWWPPRGPREEFLRWQAGRLRKFLRWLTRKVPFYAGRAPELAALPPMDKAACRAHFQALNTAGVSYEEAVAHAAAAEKTRDFTAELRPGLTVGLSSGTSGARGVFLVSRAERLRWAGVALARTLSPESLRRLLAPVAPPLRVAFFLRANSPLYTTLASRRIDFRFFDLLEPLALHAEALRRFAPEVLIAPASVLRELGRLVPRGVAPLQVVSVAETLEATDAEAIAAAFGRRPQQIYQATEGFLAHTCAAGSLHLNEDLVHIEPEWIDAGRTRFHPLVTDFTRSTQAIVRYRLDDILQVADAPCACGSPNLVLRAVEGRADEVLWLPGAVFPDSLRAVFYRLAQPLEEYSVEQHGDELRVALQPRTPALEAELRHALGAALAGLGQSLPMMQFETWRPPPPGEKRRRIRCLQRP